jgi:ComF family protein
MNRAHLLRSVTDALIAVTLAPRCAACARVLDRPLDGPICSECWLQVHPMRPPLCRTCGGMLPSWRTISVELSHCAACRRRPGSIDAGRAVGAYEGALREIVHAFKYEGRRTIGRRLGPLLRSASSELLAGADCAVPVPLHAWRRMRRGFNQASDLARALDVPVVHALWRSRATAAQTGLTAQARRRNVRGAFRISPLLSRRSLREHVIGRTIVIVDDVWTTGATLNECARVLKEAGATEVRALTVARALEPQ